MRVVWMGAATLETVPMLQYLQFPCEAKQYMVLIHIVQDLAPNLAHLTTWSDIGHLAMHPMDGSLLAQQTFDTDVFAATRNWFSNFVASGQAWALIIGLVIGYILRSLTSYG